MIWPFKRSKKIAEQETATKDTLIRDRCKAQEKFDALLEDITKKCAKRLG